MARFYTTSGGGMLVAADKALIDHARKLSAQARDPAPYYQHSEIIGQGAEARGMRIRSAKDLIVYQKAYQLGCTGD